jgi:hypothetical protein
MYQSASRAKCNAVGPRLERGVRRQRAGHREWEFVPYAHSLVKLPADAFQLLNDLIDLGQKRSSSGVRLLDNKLGGELGKCVSMSPPGPSSDVPVRQ